MKALHKRMVIGGVIVAALAVGAGVIYAVTTVVSPLNVEYIPTQPHTTMQTFDVNDCANMPPYTTLVLTDTRGNNQDYRIRKMPDGRCWMIDNLKLGGTGSDITLTPADTNLHVITTPNNSNSPANPTGNFVLPANPIVNAAGRATNGRCDSTVVSVSGTDGAMTCTGTTTVTGTDDDEIYNFAGYADPSNAANTGGSDSCIPGAPGLSADSLTGCGYLYNWYTATAGTGVYDTPADTAANANTAPSDICPAGWHLPKAGAGGTTGNEFATLNGAMYNGGAASVANNADTQFSWRANGPFAGAYSGGWVNGFDAQGYYGFYWSSSAVNATSARYLYFHYSHVNLGSSDNGKGVGYSVRCIL
jgi:uncharacterized protein (TIGR02145 family)